MDYQLTGRNPMTSLSADKIMEALSVGRQQNENGVGIPFDEAMKVIGQQFEQENANHRKSST